MFRLSGHLTLIMMLILPPGVWGCAGDLPSVGGRGDHLPSDWRRCGVGGGGGGGCYGCGGDNVG